MAKTTTETVISRAKSRVLKGKVAPVTIVLVTKAASLTLTGGAFYVLAFFFAIQVVPLTMGFVKAGSGVTMDMPIETILSVWIVPGLFLVALIFALVLLIMRTILRWRTAAVKAVARWALGIEDVAVEQDSKVRPPAKRRGASRPIISTKAA